MIDNRHNEFRPFGCCWRCFSFDPDMLCCRRMIPGEYENDPLGIWQGLYGDKITDDTQCATKRAWYLENAKQIEESRRKLYKELGFEQPTLF